MLFSIRLAAKAAAFLSVLGLTSARGDTHLCEGDGPFQVTKMYGQAVDELAFCDTKWDKGISVTGLQMWATKNHVKAFQLTFSDGTKGDLHGNNKDTEGNGGNWYGTGQLSWKEGDLVSDVHFAGSYWGNGDRLGGMTMVVADQKFECKSDIGSFAGEPQDFASGLLIGAYGSAGDDINSFGFVFLKQTAGKAEIIDMKFPQTLEDLNNRDDGVEDVSLKSILYKNSSPDGEPNQTYTFASTETKTNSRTITTTFQHALGVSVSTEISAKVGVPEVAEITAKTTVGVSYQFTDITSTADMKMNADATGFTQGGTLAPGKGAICEARSKSGTYSTDYTNIVQITLSGGQKFTVEQPAHFNAVGWTKAVVDCTTVDIKDLPNGGKDADEIGSPTKRAVSFKA